MFTKPKLSVSPEMIPKSSLLCYKKTHEKFGVGLGQKEKELQVSTSSFRGKLTGKEPAKEKENFPLKEMLMSIQRQQKTKFSNRKNTDPAIFQSPGPSSVKLKLDQQKIEPSHGLYQKSSSSSSSSCNVSTPAYTENEKRSSSYNNPANTSNSNSKLTFVSSGINKALAIVDGDFESKEQENLAANQAFSKKETIKKTAQNAFLKQPSQIQDATVKGKEKNSIFGKKKDSLSNSREKFSNRNSFCKSPISANPSSHSPYKKLAGKTGEEKVGLVKSTVKLASRKFSAGIDAYQSSFSSSSSSNLVNLLMQKVQTPKQSALNKPSLIHSPPNLETKENLSRQNIRTVGTFKHSCGSAETIAKKHLIYEKSGERKELSVNSGGSTSGVIKMIGSKKSIGATSNSASPPHHGSPLSRDSKKAMDLNVQIYEDLKRKMGSLKKGEAKARANGFGVFGRKGTIGFNEKKDHEVSSIKGSKFEGGSLYQNWVSPDRKGSSGKNVERPSGTLVNHQTHADYLNKLNALMKGEMQLIGTKKNTRNELTVKQKVENYEDILGKNAKYLKNVSDGRSSRNQKTIYPSSTKPNLKNLSDPDLGHLLFCARARKKLELDENTLLESERAQLSGGISVPGSTKYKNREEGGSLYPYNNPSTGGTCTEASAYLMNPSVCLNPSTKEVNSVLPTSGNFHPSTSSNSNNLAGSKCFNQKTVYLPSRDSSGAPTRDHSAKNRLNDHSLAQNTSSNQTKFSPRGQASGVHQKLMLTDSKLIVSERDLGDDSYQRHSVVAAASTKDSINITGNPSTYLAKNKQSKSIQSQPQEKKSEKNASSTVSNIHGKPIRSREERESVINIQPPEPNQRTLKGSSSLNDATLKEEMKKIHARMNSVLVQYKSRVENLEQENANLKNELAKINSST